MTAASAGVVGVARALGELRDAVVDVADGLGEQRGHRGGRRVRRAAHDLRLADRVLGVVEDPVDPARQREEVLGVERRDERVAQRVAQLALGGVGLVLERADGRGRLRVAAGGRPGGERVHPLAR